MGCDWSKTAGSVDDLRDAPYSLLSVAVEEGKIDVVKMNKGRMANNSAAKKRDKRKGSSSREEFAAPVPVSSTSEQDGTKPKFGINLPKGLNQGDAMDKENLKQGMSGPDVNAGLKQKLQLDISKTKEVAREPTERQLRTEKLARYERECTKIEDYMYVGGILVAQNKELLVGVGITHIVNCSAITTDNYFPDTFKYKALFINDAPGEDLACHIYDVLRFIDEVRNSGGKVLVHCTQGVSRSCSFCIAYKMMDKNLSYDEGFNYLKARRGICNPNAGFCSQLVKWGRRVLDNFTNRGTVVNSTDYQPRVFRIDYYYPVKKAAGMAPISEDVSRGVLFSSESAYIFETQQQFFVWIGSGSLGDHEECANVAIKDLQKFEGAPADVKFVKQGQEPAIFLQQLKELNCTVPGGSALDAPADKKQEEPPSGHSGGEPEGRKAFPQGGIACEVQTPRLSLNLVGSTKEGVSVDTKAHASVAEEDDEEELGKIRMFEFPSWEELHNFDSDDLWPSKVSAPPCVAGADRLACVLKSGNQAFVLIERATDAVPVHVWIGEGYPQIDNIDDEEECQSFAMECARKFTESTGIAIEEVHAIAEGKEPDDFWDLFELG